MKTKHSLYLGVAAVAIALAFGTAPTPVSAQQAAAVAIGATDIGGVVTGPKGPEAGVWVIAETTDLPMDEQDGRHRRPGPLCHPGTAESQLRGMGARLRPRRFRQDHQRARQDHQHHCDPGAE